MTTSSPPPEDQSPSLLSLYEKIGYFITRWALAEELFYVVYTRCLGLPEGTHAAEFFEVDSYRMRQTFTLMAIRGHFLHARDKKDEWERRVKDFNGYYATRNYLAHNPVHEPQLSIDFVSQRALSATTYVVHPSFYQKKGMKRLYTSKDIASEAASLDRAIAELRLCIQRDFPTNAPVSP